MAWRDVAAADLAEGLHPVTLADGRGIVIVHREERWWALRDICPHQGAKLSAGSITGRVPPCLPGEQISMLHDELVLLCPWHGWEYDVETGRCLTDPDHTRVRVYPTKIEDGRVWVELG